jgi:hypothetical protein
LWMLLLYCTEYIGTMVKRDIIVGGSPFPS